MSWIAKEIVKAYGIKKEELEILKGREDDGDVWERVLLSPHRPQDLRRLDEFLGLMGIEELYILYNNEKIYIDIMVEPDNFSLSMLLIFPELVKKGYSIEIPESIPIEVHIIPKEGKPIIASTYRFSFPLGYALHPEHSKIIDKIAKEVYELSPPENYEK